MVQQLRESQDPRVGRAKDAVWHRTQRAINRAYMILWAHGEDRQRMIEGDGSSTTGQSHAEDWEEEYDEGVGSEEAW